MVTRTLLKNNLRLKKTLKISFKTTYNNKHETIVQILNTDKNSIFGNNKILKYLYITFI